MDTSYMREKRMTTGDKNMVFVVHMSNNKSELNLAEIWHIIRARGARHSFGSALHCPFLQQQLPCLQFRCSPIDTDVRPPPSGLPTSTHSRDRLQIRNLLCCWGGGTVRARSFHPRFHLLPNS